MSDIKQQIFQELSTLEDIATRLRSTAVNAGRQTDLEVAILTEQVKSLLREIVLETLRSPEGQAAIRKALK